MQTYEDAVNVFNKVLEKYEQREKLTGNPNTYWQLQVLYEVKTELEKGKENAETVNEG